MKQLPTPDRCCGCSACFAACQHGAIEMKPDVEGFLQPVVNKKVCIDCGRCADVCPVLHQDKPRKPIAVYAAKAKDDALRKISSSGGIFSLLARTVLAGGGVVYGAAFAQPTHKVVHKAAFDETGLDELRGSKYAQSDMGDTFRQVRQTLSSGNKVLFSGCPCQIAGLRRFLGKEYDNLLLVDVICHAVPSPLAWHKYLSCQEHKERAKITRTFSRRNCSWKKYSLSLEFVNSNGDAYLVNPASDSYLKAFCSELFNRKCCEDCSFRAFKGGADITIGDFWGVEKYLPSVSDDVGISAVMVLSRKGNETFGKIGDLLCTRESNLKSVAKDNKTILGNHSAHKNRKRFFSEATEDNFDELVDLLLMPPLWYRILRWVKWHTIGKPGEK